MYKQVYWVVAFCCFGMLVAQHRVFAGEDEKKENSEAWNTGDCKKKKRMLLINLESPISEYDPRGILYPRIEAMLATYAGLSQQQLATSPGKDGLIMSIKDPELSMDQYWSLMKWVRKVRKNNIPVHMFVRTFTTVWEYLLASSGTDVTLSPAGSVPFEGITEKYLFWKDFLKLFHVKGQFYQVGRYKGAAEVYMRSEASPAFKLSRQQSIDVRFNFLKKQIASNRKVSQHDVDKWFEEYIIFSEDALQKKIVDDVMSFGSFLLAKGVNDAILHPFRLDTERSQFLPSLKDIGRFFLNQMFSKQSEESVITEEHQLFKNRKHANGVAQIPILNIDGVLEDSGKLRRKLDRYLDLLSQFNVQSNVKGVVLRVNSPGGSPVAADLLFQQIKGMSKPVVLSVGEMAASAAFYFGVATDRIFATPFSQVGSIGVLYGNFITDDLFNKAHLGVEVFSSGKHADMYEGRAWSETEKNILGKYARKCYNQFVDRVAEGRKMSRSDVLSYAGGKLYEGEEAKKIGFVDEIGGLQDAILWIAKQQGLQDYVISPYPRDGFSLLEMFAMVGFSRNFPFLGTLPGFSLFQEQTNLKIYNFMHFLNLFRRHRAVMVTPFYLGKI